MSTALSSLLSSGSKYWDQQGATVSESSGPALGNTAWHTVLDITDECLVTAIYLNLLPNSRGSIRVTKDGNVLFNEERNNTNTAYGYFKSVVGQYLDGLTPNQSIGDVYQPPSPPLYCKQSLKVEVKNSNIDSRATGVVNYTLGSFKDIDA